jgi:hypothetical protein
MTARTGTITSITFPERVYTGVGVIQKAIVGFSLATTYTASSDEVTIAGVGAAIKSQSGNGKTCTLLSASFWDAGKDATGTKLYPSDGTVAGACTISADAVVTNIKAADLSTEASCDSGGTTVPCKIVVCYTEA